jgi:hypothetical protein
MPSIVISARRYRAETRSVHEVHEDSDTELTPQSRKNAFLEMPFTSNEGVIGLEVHLRQVDDAQPCNYANNVKH